MLTRKLLVAAVALQVAFLAAISCPAATVYTWQSTGDTDWNNATNWDSNGVPVDENSGAGGLNGDMTIAFSGTVMPTTNVPGMGGLNASNKTPNTPMLDLHSGGSLTVDYVGLNDGIVLNLTTTATPLIVGDGIGGGTEDVTLNVNGGLDLSRHSGGVTFTTVVNPDGTLNIGGNLNLAYHSSRQGILDVNGGQVSVGGNLYSLNSTSGTDPSQSKILIHDGGTVNITGRVANTVGYGVTFDLMDTTGSFTAQFGNDFPNLDAVRSQIGTVFVTSGPGLAVQAVDNFNNTFTVTAVPEPGTVALMLSGLIGLAGLAACRRRR